MTRKKIVRKKIVKEVPVDPAAPGVAITLDGKTYRLVFTYESLALAEGRLAKTGIHVNMLAALDFVRLGASQLPYLFYATLLKYHPALEFEDARKLLTMPTLQAVHGAVVDAYLESMPKREREKSSADPTQGPPAT